MSERSGTIRPGLVSVTFRALAPREIVLLAATCGLEGIEWGGDVHVPDARAAREVRLMTEDAGLTVAAYGSYWRASGEFGTVLQTAVSLGAPTVRAWAGTVGSAGANRVLIVRALREACERAAQAGMTLSLEYHAGTLTDTLASTLQLAEEIDHPALRLLWQPVPERSPSEREAEVRALLPRLGNLHVFQWVRQSGETRRRPLREGEREWPEVLRLAGHPTPIPSQGEGVRFALMEFVPGDDPDILSPEAATLRRWLS